MRQTPFGSVGSRTRVVLAVSMLALGVLVPPAAADFSSTPTCDAVEVWDPDAQYEVERLIPTDDGYLALRTTSYDGTPVLTGHDFAGLLTESVGGEREQPLPISRFFTRSHYLAGPATGPRVLVQSWDDANRSRLIAYDLDGTRQTTFGNNGELVFGVDSQIDGVAERPSGALVIWVETPTGDGGLDRRLHLVSATGTPTGEVPLAPDALTGNWVANIVASGENHIWVLNSDDTYGFQTWVDRVAVADGTRDAGFAWDNTIDPSWIANLDGKLLALSRERIARLYNTNGSEVTTFGSSGQVDLSGTLEDVTVLGTAPGNRVVVGGVMGFDPDRIGAVMLGTGGVVTSAGASGVFGPVDSSSGLTAVAGLVDGSVVLETTTTRILAPNGQLASDCGPFDAPRVVRRSGNDRYATAAALVATVPATDTVVIATGQDFPDALAGGAAAAALGGPLLLVTKGDVPAPTREQLERLRPSRIVVLGGPNSIADSVMTFLQQQSWGPSVKRVFGPDRYATAIEASREAFPDGTDWVFLATGAGFADALAAVPAAAYQHAPILLTPGNLTASVVAEIDRLSPSGGIIVVGGPNSVSYDVEPQLMQSGWMPERFAGQDRFQTAALIASFLPAETGAAFLASGGVFADALAAGPIAARRAAPLLLTSADRLPEQARAELARRSAQVVYIAGGPNTVNDSVLARLDGRTLGYTFMGYRDAGETTHGQWNACVPIPWRWNRGGSPDSDLAFLQAGFASVSQQTGVTFAYQGTTDQEPYAGFSPDFVTVGFTDMLEAGLAGPQVRPGSPFYTGGTLALSNVLSGQSFDGASFASLVMVHEVGHVLGLAHVRSPYELMTEGILDDSHTSATFKAGDLAGLAQTLARPSC